MRYLPALLFAVVAALLPRAVLADMRVGNTPTLDVRTLDGGKFHLADYHGKMVLIDFWATWCGPCVTEAPHMIAINEKYGPKGLQILGISLDHELAPVKPGVEKLGFTWPQYFDQNGNIANPWGVNSIPRCFLIGPDGDVIWTGHPAELDKPLADAFGKTPPQLVDPKMLADTKSLLDRAEAELDSSNPLQAMIIASRIPLDASKDEATAKRIDELKKKISKAGDKMLAEIDSLLADKKYAEAASRLRELANSLPEQPLGQAAKQKLNALMAKPEVKQQLAQAEKLEKAHAALVAAEQLQAQKRDEQAYASFKSIVKEFAGTDAATSADEAIKAYDADPAFAQKLAAKQAQASADKAKAALSLAESYRTSNRIDLAKKKYREVIDQFPDTPEARQAKTQLAKLGS